MTAPSTMKAVVHDRYGSPDDVLQLREIAVPAVGDGNVLVRVRAASVHPDVWHVVTGTPVRAAPDGQRRAPAEASRCPERIWPAWSSPSAGT